MNLMTTHRSPLGASRVNRPSTWLALAGLIGVLTGCRSVGPDYTPPAATAPDHWQETEAVVMTSDAPALAEWWDHLADPALEWLILRALEGSLDLREAAARLREARARRGVAAADWQPSVEGGASYWRSGDSERTAPGTALPDSEAYRVGLDATWEVDLWGRVRRAVEAADAELAASAELRRDLGLAVAAETAVAYVELRAFQRRIDLALTNVRLQEQTLQLVQSRYDAGLVGERDVAQAATNVEVTRARLPAFERGRRAAENRLAVLLGLTPGALAAELEQAGPIPVPPLTAAVGVPADMLRRRPDVRAAERFLAAEHARIGVVLAERYPQLALAGTLGAAGEEAPDLFRRGSGFFGLGPSVRWNLFDGGRVRRAVDVQDARAEQALIRWERTVLRALEETENALTGFVRGQARRQALLDAATQARRAVELAQFEYREGLSDFQTVLDSERALAQLEDEVAQADALIATQFVALQKALGG